MTHGVIGKDVSRWAMERSPGASVIRRNMALVESCMTEGNKSSDDFDDVKDVAFRKITPETVKDIIASFREETGKDASEATLIKHVFEAMVDELFPAHGELTDKIMAWEDSDIKKLEKDIKSAITILVKAALKKKSVSESVVVVDDMKNAIAINKQVRTKINVALNHLTTPGNKTKYFDSIPIGDMFDLLEKNGVKAIDEDGTPWSGLFMGRDGSANIQLAVQDESGWKLVRNSLLVIQWHKMESGKYEMNAYLS